MFEKMFEKMDKTSRIQEAFFLLLVVIIQVCLAASESNYTVDKNHYEDMRKSEYSGQIDEESDLKSQYTLPMTASAPPTKNLEIQTETEAVENDQNLGKLPQNLVRQIIYQNLLPNKIFVTKPEDSENSENFYISSEDPIGKKFDKSSEETLPGTAYGSSVVDYKYKSLDKTSNSEPNDAQLNDDLELLSKYRYTHIVPKKIEENSEEIGPISSTISPENFRQSLKKLKDYLAAEINEEMNEVNKNKDYDYAGHGDGASSGSNEVYDEAEASNHGGNDINDNFEMQMPQMEVEGGSITRYFAFECDWIRKPEISMVPITLKSFYKCFWRPVYIGHGGQQEHSNVNLPRSRYHSGEY